MGLKAVPPIFYFLSRHPEEEPGSETYVRVWNTSWWCRRCRLPDKGLFYWRNRSVGPLSFPVSQSRRWLCRRGSGAPGSVRSTVLGDEAEGGDCRRARVSSTADAFLFSFWLLLVCRRLTFDNIPIALHFFGLALLSLSHVPSLHLSSSSTTHTHSAYVPPGSTPSLSFSPKHKHTLPPPHPTPPLTSSYTIRRAPPA